MYRYDEFDRALVLERVEQFRDQVERHLAGELSDEEFTPLRLRNGLYQQRHAYMLRIAIPYGTLSSNQLRMLATIAEKYDRAYGHFTTRQNIQFNWLKLEDVPALLAELATVDMHSIQTSGNCIRNITADPFAGVAADEIADPRPLAELLRQWSTLHPEFAYLPRKFKFAISGSAEDRAALLFHDIGIRIVRNNAGLIAYTVLVGGGQGRTPAVGQVLYPFVTFERLLPCLESILRVYNLHGRRDNKYKARIKILVKSLGLDAFRDAVDADMAAGDPAGFVLAADEHARIRRYFALPYTGENNHNDDAHTPASSTPWSKWLAQNITPHRYAERAIVTITLKGARRPPGDASAEEMRVIADLAERYSHGELRISYAQNVVLPHVPRHKLPALWRELTRHDLADANLGLASDIIACPGLDFCNLANARSIPLAQKIAASFATDKTATETGPLSINISGCMNACGHHHAANIGVLGVEKGGREYYQLTLGGEAGNNARIGERLGPAVEADTVVEMITGLTSHYRAVRMADESFNETLARLGIQHFREALDATGH